MQSLWMHSLGIQTFSRSPLLILHAWLMYMHSLILRHPYFADSFVIISTSHHCSLHSSQVPNKRDPRMHWLFVHSSIPRSPFFSHAVCSFPCIKHQAIRFHSGIIHSSLPILHACIRHTSLPFVFILPYAFLPYTIWSPHPRLGLWSVLRCRQGNNNYSVRKRFPYPRKLTLIASTHDLPCLPSRLASVQRVMHTTTGDADRGGMTLAMVSATRVHWMSSYRSAIDLWNRLGRTTLTVEMPWCVSPQRALAMETLRWCV